MTLLICSLYVEKRDLAYLLLTHSHTMTPFDAPGKQAFWKHWEKEKLIVTSNFSFSHCVFYLFG